MQTTLGINGTGLRVGFESPGIRGEEERVDWHDGKFVKNGVVGGTQLRQFMPHYFKFLKNLKTRWFNSVRIQGGSIRSEVERRELSRVVRMVKIQNIVLI